MCDLSAFIKSVCTVSNLWLLTSEPRKTPVACLSKRLPKSEITVPHVLLFLFAPLPRAVRSGISAGQAGQGASPSPFSARRAFPFPFCTAGKRVSRLQTVRVLLRTFLSVHHGKPVIRHGAPVMRLGKRLRFGQKETPYASSEDPPVDARTTRCTGSVMCRRSGCLPSMICKSVSAASRPISSVDWCTEVRGTAP